MPGPTGPSPKLLGRIAAVVLAVVFAGIVWWSISSSPPPTTPRPGADFSDAPDITDVEKAQSIVLTLADRDDPTRTAGVIEADRLDPVGNGERLLTNPRAWLYPEQNRAVRVTAERARLLMPLNETPESGTLEGAVRVRVYESQSPGTPPPDDAQPILTVDFDQPVRFERRYMRLSTPGAFTVDSPRVRFSGEDMTVMLNEVRRRLESLDVARHGRLEFDLAAADPSEPPARPTTPATPTDDPTQPPATTPTRPPKIDLYETRLTTAVTASIADIQVDADRLDLFTRLTDNTLPPQAIARIAFAASNTQPTPPADPGAIMPTPDDAPPPSTEDPGPTTTSDPTPTTANPTDRLILTWSGPMSVRPIDTDTPEPLAHDDAAIILHADEAGAVRMADRSSDIRLQAARAAYFATRAHLHLDPTDATPIRITAANNFQARPGAIRADLLAGAIDLPGRGDARSDTAGIDWTHHAHLTLARDDDDRLTDRLSHATFQGSVSAGNDDAIILADELATDFDQADDRAVLRAARITRGSIAARTQPNQPARSLAADTIDARFITLAGRTDPARITAEGSVNATADNATLQAHTALATLERDHTDRIAVRSAQARGDVRYTAPNNTAAAGAALDVDGPAETIRITGPDSMVAQGDSTIHAADIHLDANTRRMTVEGPGRFEHTLRGADALPAGRVLARWTESMRFDDALGRLNALGEVSVISTPDALTRDTLAARRIEVEITPQPIRDSVGGRGSTTRQLLVARAFGDSDADAYHPATVETRRYDPADPERVTGLLFLEADQITADNRAAILRVPGAGTLLVMDRRDENAPAQEAQPNTLGPGLTRFTWQGAFELDRNAGVAVMDDRVLVRHKTIAPPGSPAATQTAELATDTLTATFAESDTADNPFTLRAADARGSVRFLANNKQLLADAARFEADTNTLHALALPGRLVELREPNRPAPLSARAIQWDLARDRVEINRPSPVTLPN